MQNNASLAPHEMLELHELINGEIVSLKRTQASMSMVNDNELKNYMQQCLNSKKTAIQQIQNFINTQYNSCNNQNQNNQNQKDQNQNQDNQSDQSSQKNGGNSTQNSSS